MKEVRQYLNEGYRVFWQLDSRKSYPTQQGIDKQKLSHKKNHPGKEFSHMHTPWQCSLYQRLNVRQQCSGVDH